ncbi:MAG: aldehyde dehydrogenase family protein, partial [Planctomycetota bacterium]
PPLPGGEREAAQQQGEGRTRHIPSLVPTTSLIPDFADRVQAVNRFRALLAQHSDDLVRLMGQEIHKPEFEALASDVLPLLASCTWHIKHAKRVLQDRKPPGKPLWLLGVSHRVARRPLGRVAIIATWNYPVQLVGVQIVQAFMGGNEVIVKPSERSPRTQALLLDLFMKAGFKLVRLDPSREAGEELVAKRDFHHLVFTGSTAVGREIAGVLARRLIPSTLELSGNDTAIVCTGADVELAAKAIWYAFTLNHGQTCMAPRRVAVEYDLHEPLLAEFKSLGELAEPRKLIDRSATEWCRQVGRAALEADGQLIVGDLEADPLRPIVIASDRTDTALYRGDHFGPLLVVARLRDEYEPRGPLTLSVFGSKDESRRWSSLSSAGTMTFNDAIIPTGHPGAPLSAVGNSGWGVSRGVEGLLAMTRPVSISTTPKRVRLPLDPPGTPVSKITPWLRRLYPVESKATRTEDSSA